MTDSNGLIVDKPKRFNVQQRLDYVRRTLAIEGKINRRDIINRFGVSMPQASRDLQDVMAESPDLMVYDKTEKCYRKNPAAAVTPCQHEGFGCNAKIGRLSQVEGGPITHYCAEITVICARCGEPFEFVGLPIGSSAYRPTVSFDGHELRAPITPQGMKPPEGLIGFSVKVEEASQ